MSKNPKTKTSYIFDPITSDDRKFTCPKCYETYINDMDGYIKHRIKCSKYDKNVIQGMRMLGLDPDRFLKKDPG